jgi:hypothetical protein
MIFTALAASGTPAPLRSTKQITTLATPPSHTPAALRTTTQIATLAPTQAPGLHRGSATQSPTANTSQGDLAQPPPTPQIATLSPATSPGDPALLPRIVLLV